MSDTSKKHLREMSVADVIRQAVLISGKTQEDIEAKANLRPGILDQFACRYDHHWPTMLNISGLCVALGNDLLIKWLQAQYDARAVHKAPDMPLDAIMRETLLSGAEYGDFARAVEAALQDRKLSRKERMRIRREAMELVARLINIVNGVSGGI